MSKLDGSAPDWEVESPRILSTKMRVFNSLGVVMFRSIELVTSSVRVYMATSILSSAVVYGD